MRPDVDFVSQERHLSRSCCSNPGKPSLQIHRLAIEPVGGSRAFCMVIPVTTHDSVENAHNRSRVHIPEVIESYHKSIPTQS